MEEKSSATHRARQTKKYITSLTLLETCAIANLAWTEALIDKEFGDVLLETLQTIMHQRITDALPELKETYPTVSGMFTELGEFASSHYWLTLDDFFNWLGLKRISGPPFYRARAIFKEHCTNLGVPIRGYL